jgi:small subunit ribosomal protein S1
MKDIFGDDIESQGATKDESFASLFAQSEKKLDKKLRSGDHLTAEILSIGKEESFVSTGTPVDALILNNDLLDENKQIKYKVGDMIDVVVTQVSANEIRVCKKGSKNASETDDLEDAFDMELPVEGKILELVNGGFRVQVQSAKAFCPLSQIDLRFTQDPSIFVGKKFNFLITKYESKGKNIVVSRRQLLELEKAETEGTFMQSAKVGDIFSGKITRLEKFGAFVEIDNGIEGLVHISEMGWSRISDPSEVVTTGQTVQVKLLKIEELNGKLKISFSIKQAGGEGDPWLKVPAQFPVGTVVTGTIEKKENYGFFVQLAPGVTGLLPKSKWKDNLNASGIDQKKKGDTLMVQVDQILFEEKKISLGLPGEGDDRSWTSHTQTTSSGSGFGSLHDQLKNFSIGGSKPTSKK